MSEGTTAKSPLARRHGANYSFDGLESYMFAMNLLKDSE